MKKIILGIDPGIADTGYGVISKEENGQISCLTYGSIKTKAGLELTDRLKTLNNELNELIKKYQPCLMAIEQLFFCNNAKTALLVGQARGVALLTAAGNNLPVKEYTPLQLKQAVTTYGQADKLQVQKMIKLLLNLNELPRPDDAADALAAAICAVNEVKFNI